MQMGWQKLVFKRNTVGEAPTMIFLYIIRTQLYVPANLNLGGGGDFDRRWRLR
jgi:hypothetical protein